jgi:site-specific DNA-methyltransferase (adenine-specific)
MGKGEPTMQNGLRESQAGRWPSNVLLSDPDLFDVANPGVVGSGAVTDGEIHNQRAASIFGTDMGSIPKTESQRDTGGYSRFFIIPKADRADREPVLRGQVPEGRVAGRNRADGRQWDIPGSTLANNKPNRENVHPTVKPVDLMRHLIRLVTPVTVTLPDGKVTAGTVLDCFLGSGSTAIAAEMEGFEWIGIEKEAEYVQIAEARLNGTQRGLGLPA